MTVPIRIQRQRKKGWRKPAGTVCVTRGTLWGNPFVVRPDLEAGTKLPGGCFAVPTVEDAVECYRLMLDETPDLVEKAKRNLKGKDLACWCPLGHPCHGDVLLEIANR